MKCPMCDRQFDEAQAQKACRSCAVFGGCKLVKCPFCGHEMPREPGWISALRKWRRARSEKGEHELH